MLLASLGTESNEQPEFFRSFGDAFKDEEWHAVLTLGKGVEAAGLGLGDHLEAHSWLPHDQVLPHARVFICHGGIGSIMEALAHDTPLVVVPQTPEHRFTAGHVTELGLGRTLPHGELTPRTLRAVVDEVANDTAIRENVLRMSRHIREAGGAAAAADALEGWLA